MILPEVKHLRTGQFLFNFLSWLHFEKGYSPHPEDKHMADPFYIQDDKFAELLNEYVLYLDTL